MTDLNNWIDTGLRMSQEELGSGAARPLMNTRTNRYIYKPPQEYSKSRSVGIFRNLVHKAGLTSGGTIFSTRVDSNRKHYMVMGLDIAIAEVPSLKLKSLHIPSLGKIEEALDVYNKTVGLVSSKGPWQRKTMDRYDFLNRVRYMWKAMGITAHRKGAYTIIKKLGHLVIPEKFLQEGDSIKIDSPDAIVTYGKKKATVQYGEDLPKSWDLTDHPTSITWNWDAEPRLSFTPDRLFETIDLTARRSTLMRGGLTGGIISPAGYTAPYYLFDRGTTGRTRTTTYGELPAVADTDAMEAVDQARRQEDLARQVASNLGMQPQVARRIDRAPQGRRDRPFYRRSEY